MGNPERLVGDDPRNWRWKKTLRREVGGGDEI